MRMALTSPESQGSRCFESIAWKRADYIQLTALTGDGVSFFDIHGCTDVRVTKVFRYIEQRDVLVDENAGEGVSQVVEADVPHAVLLKHL